MKTAKVVCFTLALACIGVFGLGNALAAAYPGDEVKIKRQAILCRAVPYLAEIEALVNRGDKISVNRYLNNSRCKQIRSTIKGVIIKYGYEEGRTDFVKVKARKKEYWVRYSDLKT